MNEVANNFHYRLMNVSVGANTSMLPNLELFISDIKETKFTLTSAYKQFQIILRLFDVLPNFPLTTSETMGDYYLQTCYILAASRVSEQFNS